MAVFYCRFLLFYLPLCLFLSLLPPPSLPPSLPLSPLPLSLPPPLSLFIFPLPPSLLLSPVWCSIGLGICYNDMRFPELACLYTLQGESGRTVSPLQVNFLLFSIGCQFVCFHGGFNMTTGPAHWELLIHSRWDCVQNPLTLSTLHMFLYTCNCWWPQAVVKFSTYIFLKYWFRIYIIIQNLFIMDLLSIMLSSMILFLSTWFSYKITNDLFVWTLCMRLATFPNVNFMLVYSLIVYIVIRLKRSSMVNW